MSGIPSKWAFPDDDSVLIVPIKIGDSYFTAVIDAPDDWNNNLIVSGFKQSSEGWVKRGLANEYELAYLSESLSIRDVDESFFFDHFNPVDDVSRLVVPNEIANAIDWLAAEGRNALLFELSIQQPNVTDATVSICIEKAIAGEVDEFVDTVYELAIERIKLMLDGKELSDSVVQFAKEKDISLVVQSDDILSPQGSVLLTRGERVAWVEDGAEQYGRVSRPLRVGDEGCWVHSLPVAWVGGQASPREVWVSSEVLGFTVEPLESDVLMSNSGGEYEDARTVLAGVSFEQFNELASRIFMSIPEDLVPNSEGQPKEVWISSGKLWVDDTFFEGWGFSSDSGASIELSDGLCALSQEDRDLIKDVDHAMSVIDRANFGDDGYERVTLNIRGQHLKSKAYVYASYGLSGLLSDGLYMRVNDNSVRFRESDSEAGQHSMLDMFEAVHDGISKRVAGVKSFLPRSNEGAVIVDASLVRSGMNEAVRNNIAFTRFKDRVIDLGLEGGLPDDLAFRVIASSGNRPSDWVVDITPPALKKQMTGAKKAFSAKSVTDSGVSSYSTYSQGEGFHVYKLVLSRPVFVSEAFSKLIRDDENYDLPKEYFAVSGSALGRYNELMAAKKKEYNIPSVYLSKTSTDGDLVFSEAEFKAGFEHLSERYLDFQMFLKGIGAFDDLNVGDDTPVFSSERYDLWGKSAERLVDILKITDAARVASELPERTVREFVDAEVARKLSPMFTKAGFDEKTITNIKDGIAKSVLGAISQKKKSSWDRSAKTEDVVAFSVSRTHRSINWRYSEFSTLSVGADDGVDWMSEPRGAIIDHGVSSSFSRTRGIKLHIDLLSLVDPELAGKLYMLGEDQAQSVVEKENDLEGYQDTGVVTGYAIKDLRAMSIDSLLVATSNMTASQRDKYVKKDLYFPRPDLVELQKMGCSPQAALFLDLAWVGLPSKPFSTLSADVDTYGRLIGAMSEGYTEFMLDNQRSLLQDRVLSKEFFVAFDAEVSSRSARVLEGLGYDQRSFLSKSTRLKGSRFMTSFGMDSRYDFAAGQREIYCDDAAQYFGYSRVKKGGEQVMVNDVTWDHLLPKKKKSSSAGVAKKAALNPDIRTGEDYRNGKVVDSEDFIKTFGFSGVEFGNWTNQAERETHINLSYDSMRDFSKLLECEPMALSLGGRLGLCFGSRGRGGKNPASAHYEPSNMAINLTRKSGIGSLAHEYFHAIAGHYGEVESGIKGADYTEKVGNLLSGADDKSDYSFTPLMREELQVAFRDLMRSVMYQPRAGQDAGDISNYTERSDLYLGSIELDKSNSRSGKKYWSSPHEMFARSMEVWVGVELAKSGYRNDYLVKNSAVQMNSSAYPDPDHIKRITVFADKWVGALRTELKQVQHPYLGEINMPIFHTKNRAVQPLNQVALESFAHSEMKVLFGKIKPMLEVRADIGSAAAGSYDLIKDLITLNSNSADKSVFYHEAWHVCQAKLLNDQEKHLVAEVFSSDLAKTFIADAMRDNNFTSEAVDAALADPIELEAYAFELWSLGKLSLSARPVEQVFDVVKNVSDAAADISDTLDVDGFRRVEAIFERFYGGELALERAGNVVGGDLNHARSEFRMRGMGM